MPERTKSVLMSSGVIIALIAGLSGLGKAWIQGRSSAADMSDSYKVLATAVNDMQYRLGRLEGLEEGRMQSDKQVEGTSKKHGKKTLQMDDIQVTGMAPGASAPSAVATFVASSAPSPSIAVDGGLLAELKAEAKALPITLDEALSKEREGK